MDNELANQLRGVEPEEEVLADHDLFRRLPGQVLHRVVGRVHGEECVRDDHGRGHRLERLARDEVGQGARPRRLLQGMPPVDDTGEAPHDVLVPQALLLGEVLRHEPHLQEVGAAPLDLRGPGAAGLRLVGGLAAHAAVALPLRHEDGGVELDLLLVVPSPGRVVGRLGLRIHAVLQDTLQRRPLHLRVELVRVLALQVHRGLDDLVEVRVARQRRHLGQGLGQLGRRRLAVRLDLAGMRLQHALGGLYSLVLLRADRAHGHQQLLHADIQGLQGELQLPVLCLRRLLLLLGDLQDPSLQLGVVGPGHQLQVLRLQSLLRSLLQQLPALRQRRPPTVRTTEGGANRAAIIWPTHRRRHRSAHGAIV
mmetsp:Transcript_11914/g.26009  ORF Transcript_11914/g.26009 Transcript_11914/m.26009 type:complete len:366 (-) Transcript_11914:30-1127(-)